MAASYVRYAEAKRSSKNPEKFCTGIPKGVVEGLAGATSDDDTVVPLFRFLHLYDSQGAILRRRSAVGWKGKAVSVVLRGNGYGRMDGGKPKSSIKISL
jgi:hypothetical protein